MLREQNTPCRLLPSPKGMHPAYFSKSAAALFFWDVPRGSCLRSIMSAIAVDDLLNAQNNGKLTVEKIINALVDLLKNQ